MTTPAFPVNAQKARVWFYWWGQDGGGSGKKTTFRPTATDLTDMAAFGYIETDTKVVTPDPTTALVYADLICTDDEDLTPFLWEVTREGQTPKMIAVSVNAPEMDVGGVRMRAVPLTDAATPDPPPEPVATFYTSQQTDAVVTNAVLAHDVDPEAHPDIRALIGADGGGTGVGEPHEVVDGVDLLLDRGPLSTDVPTLAVSGPGGSDPVTGTSYPFDTAAVTKLGCVPVTVNQFETDYIQNQANGLSGSGAQPWAIEFVTAAADMSIRFRASTTTAPFWVWVDGRPVGPAPRDFTANVSPGSLSFLRLTFPNTRKRRIRVYLVAADFGGLTLAAGTAAAPPRTENIKTVMVGDSWFGNAGTVTWPDTIPTVLGRALGWETFLAGQPSTGYVANANYNTPERLASIYAANPDYVVAFGSINDSNLTGIQDAATAFYSALATNLPNAKVIVVGPQPVPGNYATYQPLLDNRDAVKAAALAAPNVIGFIDPIAGGWFTGTGNVTSPTGDGNRDYMVAPDDLHPTQLGAGYYARRLTEEIIRLFIKAGLPYSPAITVGNDGYAGVETADARYLRVDEGPLAFTSSRVGGIGDGATDNTAAWATAMSLLSGGGGELFFPPGIYGMASQPDAVPGGVLLRGTGFDYSDPTVAPPARASVIRALGTMTRLITLSPPGTGGSSDPGYTGASMQNLVADGRGLAESVVGTQGRRNYIRDCQVYWGSVRAIDIAGQNTYVIGGVQAQDDTGDVISIRFGGDHKIFDGQQRQPGATGACIRVSGSTVADVMIRGNHMWSGANAVSTPAQALIVLDVTPGNLVNVAIVDNIIEGNIGPEILILLGANQIRALKISDNMFFNANASTSYGIIEIDGNGSFVSSSIIGNTCEGTPEESYKSFIDITGAPSSTGRVSVMGNTGTYVNGVVTPPSGVPTDPFYLRGNEFRNSTATVASDNSGVATFSANGTATSFFIPHGLDGTPRYYGVTPGTSIAAAEHYVNVDATNLVVYFPTAPVSGTNNVVFSWQAHR